MEFRRLVPDDAPIILSFSEEAFGVRSGPAPAVSFAPGVNRWGVFDGERPAAVNVVREYQSWVGGRLVPTGGVASVAVAPEYRGRGAARLLMTESLRRTAEAGCVLSTLFRTAPALYRSLGFEQVGSLITAELPTAALSRMRPPGGVTLRRAGVADLPTVYELYTAVARESTLMLSRTGTGFGRPPDEVLSAFTGITLAEDGAGRAIGYLSWNRGTEWGKDGVITVTDLIATEADGYRALLAQLASWASVAPRLRLRSTGTDPLHWFLPDLGWTVAGEQPYMLRVLDLAGAVAARGFSPALSIQVDLTVEDPLMPANVGHHRLTVAGGEGRVTAGEPGGPTVGPTGLALLYSGAATCAALRRTGLVTGGAVEHDVLLDLAFAGPTPAVLDFF